MALIVATSKFQNSQVEITNAYIRLQFTALPNGIDIMAVLTPYENKQKFVENKPLFLQIPGNLRLVCGANQQQDLNTTHQLCKEVLEEMGYSVTIDLT